MKNKIKQKKYIINHTENGRQSYSFYNKTYLIL